MLAADGNLLEPPRGGAPGLWPEPGPSLDAVSALRRGEAAAEVDVLTFGGAIVRHDLAGQRAIDLMRLDRALPRAAAAFARTGTREIIAAFDLVLAPGGWSRRTSCCEHVIGFGDQGIATSGNHLGWLDAATGELVHEVSAAVASSRVGHLIRIDDDRFYVMGYHECRLQLWSHRQRARIAERRVARGDDRGFWPPCGVSIHRPSRRLLVTYGDHQVDVFALDGQPFTLERRIALHANLEHVLLSDDGKTLYIGDEDELAALRYADLVPRWRYTTTREITVLEALPGGELVAGCRDGAVLVLRDRPAGNA